MAILDVFKKKKDGKAGLDKKEIVGKRGKSALGGSSRGSRVSKRRSQLLKKTEKAKFKKVGESIQPSVKKEEFLEAYKALRFPHITEKATDLAGVNQYVFRVWQRSNKIEIKKAIEGLYKVDVVSTKIISVPSKKRRLGRIQGFRKKYKKAIVRIKKGQKIEILPR